MLAGRWISDFLDRMDGSMDGSDRGFVGTSAALPQTGSFRTKRSYPAQSQSTISALGKTKVLLRSSLRDYVFHWFRGTNKTRKPTRGEGCVKASVNTPLKPATVSL